MPPGAGECLESSLLTVKIADFSSFSLFTCFRPRAKQLQPPRDCTFKVSYRRRSASTGRGGSLPAPAHNPAAAASTPWGAKFQLTPGLAVAPLPVTRQSDLLTAKQLPGLSSAPALCQQLLGLSAPLLLQLALVSDGGVLTGGTGHGTSGSQSVPLLSALSSSLGARGAAVPGQTVCRNWGSRVSWARQDPASGCREQVHATPMPWGPFAASSLCAITPGPGVWLLCSWGFCPLQRRNAEV